MCSVLNMKCCGCMDSDRNLLPIKTGKARECYEQIIESIPMKLPENVSLYLCWECTALLVRFSNFKDQVTQSYILLNNINPVTNDLYKPQTRLKTQDQFNISYKPEEAMDFLYEVIKVEIDEEDVDSDIKQGIDYYSNDDEPLIEISKKRKKKKVVNGDTKIKNNDVEYTEIELSEEDLHKERKNLANQEDFINAMFRCDKCIISFPNADDLSDHINMKHERNALLFKCKICECSFGSEVSYSYHMNRHTRRYQCTVCSDRFASKRSAVKHYDLTHCVGTEMDFVFDRAQDVPPEKLVEDSEDQSNKTSKSFPCEFCTKTFLWRTSLRKHMETHRIENGQKRRPYCEPCKLSFTTTSNLQKHVKTSSKHQIQLKLRKLKETLPEESASPEKQQAHIEQIRSSVNSARQQFPCCQCGKRFQWRGNLLRHMKSHAAKAKGELVCEPCNRSFSSIATYRQHMTSSKKHVSEDDFKFMCSDCGKRFANKTRLKDHVDWEHLKNYVHKCDECRKVFKSHTSLYLHKQVVHKIDAGNLCDHCGKPFPNQAKLRSHMTAMHSGRAMYRCSVCGARFAWHSCLSRHVRRSHSKRPHEAPDQLRGYGTLPVVANTDDE